MKKEDAHKLMDIWLSEVMPYNDKQQYDEVLKISEKYWHNLEEPKLSNSFGYHLLVGIIICYIKTEQYEKAEYWAQIFDDFDFEACGRYDSGEKDYYLGIVYFECKNHQKAYIYFDLANKKSGGRCFQNLFGDKYKKEYKKLSKEHKI